MLKLILRSLRVKEEDLSEVRGTNTRIEYAVIMVRLGIQLNHAIESMVSHLIFRETQPQLQGMSLQKI